MSDLGLDLQCALSEMTAESPVLSQLQRTTMNGGPTLNQRLPDREPGGEGRSSLQSGRQ